MEVWKSASNAYCIWEINFKMTPGIDIVHSTYWNTFKCIHSRNRKKKCDGEIIFLFLPKSIAIGNHTKECLLQSSLLWERKRAMHCSITRNRSLQRNYCDPFKDIYYICTTVLLYKYEEIGQIGWPSWKTNVEEPGCWLQLMEECEEYMYIYLRNINKYTMYEWLSTAVVRKALHATSLWHMHIQSTANSTSQCIVQSWSVYFSFVSQWLRQRCSTCSRCRLCIISSAHIICNICTGIGLLDRFNVLRWPQLWNVTEL